MKVDYLFRAFEDIDLPDGSKGMVRALSDGEQKELQRYALLQSIETKQELEDEASDAYKVSIAPLFGIDDPGPFIAVIKEARMLDLERDAQTLYPMQFLALPEGGTDVEQREVLEQRVDLEAKTRASRKKYATDKLVDVVKKLEALSVEELREMAERLSVLVFARRTQFDAIRWATVYYSAHRYNGENMPKRLFESPEQASETPRAVIDHLFMEVSKVNNVDPWEIQKNALTDSSTASSSS